MFRYGTMSIDDFEEFSEKNVDDIIYFIQKKTGDEKN